MTDAQNEDPFLFELDRHELDRTIRFARVRCMSREEVITRALIEGNENFDAYVYRLKELKLTPAEQDLLVGVMSEMARKTEIAAPGRKSRADKMLLRLIRLLPPALALRFAEPYLDDPRKTRRKWAYVALRDTPISSANAAKLADVFRKTGDEETLAFITSTPECVRILGADFLLKRISARDQDYLRARVLQAVLHYDRDAALAMSRQLPWEFVYAAGRSETRRWCRQFDLYLKRTPTTANSSQSTRGRSESLEP